MLYIHDIVGVMKYTLLVESSTFRKGGEQLKNYKY